MALTGRIFDIQPFSLHDGPGTRTTVFLQGCNLRCGWCHNPESQSARGALLFYPRKCVGCGACLAACPAASAGKTARFTADCALCGACAQACYAEAVVLSGRTVGVEELLDTLLADRDIYVQSGGGVTFSGGEPLLQAEFVAALAARLRAAGVHVAAESALLADWPRVQMLAEGLDLLYADLKCATEATHRAGTGVSNERILANIRALAEAGRPLRLRTPVVPGFNADEAEMRRIGAFVAGLPGRPPLELLAYHGLCLGKYEALGRPFPCRGTVEPTETEMARWTELLRGMGLDATYSM